MSETFRAAAFASLALVLPAALAQDPPDRAAAKLVEALAVEPASETVLRDLLELHAGLPEDFELWSLYVAERLTDGKGKLGKVKGLASSHLRRLAPALDLARLRADAVGKLAGQAKRLKGPGSCALARTLHSLARVLTRRTPRLRERHLGTFEAAVARCLPEPEDVLGRLEKAMQRALADGRDDDAIRAAAILRGVAVQARRSKADIGGIEGFEKSALRMMEAVRRKQDGRRPPLAVKDLLGVPEADRPAWESAHADWSNPTVVLTPNGRYRIESTCGIRTTLMAAADAEYHHARLVRWFGKDPFPETPGIIRLSRTPADLEGQGQPHYWAPGFQSGHLTGLVLNATDRQGLAGMLTHELTHRFDGSVYPGMPSWLLEGRAVFTQTGTIWPRSETVEPRAANTGALYQAAVKGYGGPGKLAELIEGTIEEYRDNYPVGYSLWIYLTKLRQDLHSVRVEPYMRSFSAKPKWKPMERFSHFFVDGKDGRPAAFEEFAKDFSTYLWEVVSLDRFPWKTAWLEESRLAWREADAKQRELSRAAGGEEMASPFDRRILDHSNWPRLRSRSDDPAPGEKHAFAAGLWFEGQGLLEDAADAFAWARDVDELTGARLLHIAALHDRRGDAPRAWLHRLAASLRGPDPIEPGPPPADLGKVHRAVAPLLDELAAWEARAAAQEHPRVVRALAADRATLAKRAGLPAPATPDIAPAGADRPPPDCGPYLGVLADGVVEEWWAPADTVVSGNWAIDPPDVLVLGSREPLKAVSGSVKDAGVRRVFVRGREWFEGTYTMRVKVRLVSAHVGASIVVGHSRHDRGLVVNLSGGDFSYATGRSEEDRGFRSIDVRLDDLRSYDGGVGVVHGRVPFESPRTSFLLSIRVSGSFVQVRVDGKHVLSHRTATGVPVAGRVGFHLGSGLIAFEGPAVRRHRVTGPFSTCPCEHGDQPVDLTRPVAIPWGTWAGRRILGVPRDPLGAVLLLYAGRFADAWLDEGAAAIAVDSWRRFLGEDSFRARLLVAHPAGDAPEGTWGGELPPGRLLPHAGLPSLDEARATWFEEEIRRRASRRDGPSKEDARRDLEAQAPAEPIWLAIDPRGVILTGSLSNGGCGFAIELIRRLRGF